MSRSYGNIGSEYMANNGETLMFGGCKVFPLRGNKGQYRGKSEKIKKIEKDNKVVYYSIDTI